MQTVDILRDQRMQLTALLQRSQRMMPGIRRGVPSWMINARLPGKPPNLRIRHVVVNI